MIRSLFMVALFCTGAISNSLQNLKLPMPNGGVMEFVPVCVNKDGDTFSQKKIRLGDASGGFKERPTSTVLGGSFPLEQNGVKVWCFYMGKNEVTNRQYTAIFHPNKPLSEIKNKDYPVTGVSWFDVLNFGNQYNQWLFKMHKDKIPKYDKSYGFLRLPTEEEWEFAARGGMAVTVKQFNQKIPYPLEKLHEYEWFGGATSSHFKLQKVAKLKPNAIGLYDMLGNADEMTMSLFKVEYYQGRTGGFVIKGNNYTTAREKIRSAYRAEQPFYRIQGDGNLSPHSKKTLGFRMVISAVVFTSRKTQKKISSEWDSYHNNQNDDKQTALSKDPADIESIQNDDGVLLYLAKLVERVAQSDTIYNSHIDYSNHPKRSLKDIITLQGNQAEKDSYLWIKIANEQVRYIERQKQKLPASKILIDIALSLKNTPKAKQYQKLQSKQKMKIKNAISSYTQAIQNLNKIEAKAITSSLKKYTIFLKQHNRGEEVASLDRIKRDLQEWNKNGKINYE